MSAHEILIYIMAGFAVLGALILAVAVWVIAVLMEM